MSTKQFTRKGSPARNLSTSKSAIKRASAKAGDEASRTDLPAILGNFADARAVIETACRSLENDCSEETSALRAGLRMFNDAYDEFDVAIHCLSRSRPLA